MTATADQPDRSASKLTRTIAGDSADSTVTTGLAEPIQVARLRGVVAGGASPLQAVSTHRNAASGVAGLVSHWKTLTAEIGGVGLSISRLLADPDTTDVLINGVGQVWIDQGQGLARISCHLGGTAAVRALAVRMAAAAGKRLDDAQPVVDGTLPDGTRLHAVLEPISAGGTLISLRTKRSRAFSLTEMVQTGTISATLAPLLAALVTQQASLLLSGATGSGKTTLLATLLGLVPAQERIICIEEVAELAPDHPHVLHLQERRPNVQGSGAVTLSELVRAAMRMRPDRIVLGECRGPEVREVLAALNTGHQGGMATVHANSALEVPARLTALGALAGMDAPTVAAQAGAALDAIIHLRRRPSKPTRQVAQIALPQRVGAELRCEMAVELASVSAPDSARPGPGWPALARRLGFVPTAWPPRKEQPPWQ